MNHGTFYETTAQAFLELLSIRGVDYFLGNAGTDFASLVDAFAFRRAQGKARPVPLGIPHEIPLVAMAHGYYLMTGRPQTVMVHVGVGTANSLGGIMTAYRARVPVLFCAGRTPITEEGGPASRSSYIHWGQESFDQASMVREFVKWDYELRNPSQLESVVDRALTIATSEPQGPVYLSLPREVLLSPLEGAAFESRMRYDRPTFAPDPEKMEEAARLIKGARFPLIITSSVGKSLPAVQSLTALAEKEAIGVVSFNPEYMNFPTQHPCHLGFTPEPYFEEADVIMVLDCGVPWTPNRVKPKSSASIIHVGIDPFYSAYPVRSFPSDLTLQGDTVRVLSALGEIFMQQGEEKQEEIATRRARIREMHDQLVRDWETEALRGSEGEGISPQWVSHCVNKVLEENTVLVNEYDNGMKPFTGQNAGTYYCTPHGGYLGWGVGAALGIKLAHPDGVVIATVGDGSYIFSVPTACHLTASAHHLPILTIVYNNQGWEAVRRATLALHPDGWAARTDHFPLSDLKPSGAYEKICEAFRGYGERVERPDQVQPALARALKAIKKENRQALLNIICRSPGRK